MSNGLNSYDDYKGLTPDQKEFYIYERLNTFGCDIKDIKFIVSDLKAWKIKTIGFVGGISATVGFLTSKVFEIFTKS